MNEGADGSRWIFEEQETQIENDRLAIARLNTQIERLSAKMLVLCLIEVLIPNYRFKGTRSRRA